MTYLKNYRNYTLENAPYFHELSNKDNLGVFSREDMNERLTRLNEEIDEIKKITCCCRYV